MPNTFRKYTSGVYVMHSDEHGFQHGDQAVIETRHGNEVEVTVWKHIKTVKDGGAIYSVIRNDGKTRKEWLRRKVERQENAAARQNRLSNEYYHKSQKDRDFLSLGEPVKVGHHSEKKHRKIIDDAWNNIGRSCMAQKKQERHEDKAAELEARLNKEINIDTPESVELLEERVNDLETRRDEIKKHNKENPDDKHPAFMLQNLGANIRRYKERLDDARLLWDFEYVQAPKKVAKKVDIDALIDQHGGFFAFNEEQLEQGLAGRDRNDFIHLGMGLVLPKETASEFKKELKKV